MGRVVAAGAAAKLPFARVVMPAGSFLPEQRRSERRPSAVEAAAVRLLGPLEWAVQDAPPRDDRLPAWPALLSKTQLEAYVGVSWATLLKICPVPPVDIGANLVRFSRAQIDEWLSSLPAKRKESAAAVHDTAVSQVDIDRRSVALARVAERVSRARVRR